MKLARTLVICVGFSIGCSNEPTPNLSTSSPPIVVQAKDSYIFHLDAESTRLVVTHGNDVVKWDELSTLCQDLNAGSRPADAVIIQGVMLDRQGIDGANPAVEGSVATAVVYLKVNGEWREVISERFDAGFKSCTLGPEALVDSLVPPQK